MPPKQQSDSQSSSGSVSTPNSLRSGQLQFRMKDQMMLDSVSSDAKEKLVHYELRIKKQKLFLNMVVHDLRNPSDSI